MNHTKPYGFRCGAFKFHVNLFMDGGEYIVKQVIIAEKPHLGQSIMAAVGFGQFQWEDGYAESSEYIVTWAFGHLFELADLDSYFPDTGEGKKGWTLEGLPFCPRDFRYELKSDPKSKKVDSGVRKQFGIIKKLLERTDVDAVIHAGDADREGEIIIRTILNQAGNKKPVYRLWLPAQTPEDVRDGLRNMKPDNQYDDLAREGYARTIVDWLFGINLTRTATVQSGSLIRVGRVIVPIVKAIYDRDMEIRNFKPVPYFTVLSDELTNGEAIKLHCKQTFAVDSRAQAQALADQLNRERAVVTEITKEEKKISAGKLLNQDSLQARAGKQYKLSPQETLDVAQKLYDNGYITYPRTSSEYLALSEQSKANRIIGILSDLGYLVAPKDGRKSIYDDSKVEKGGHSAITPTTKIPEKGSLSTREQQVYDIILNRFLAVFCSEPCTVAHTAMTICVGDMVFTLNGDVFLQRGWMQYEDTGRSDKVLPKLAVGDEVNIRFHLAQKMTKPPAHYTVETLGKFLQNPFRKGPVRLEEGDDSEGNDVEAEAPEFSALMAEEDLPDDAEDYKAMLAGLEIGTVATRAGIINKAIDSEYIALKNNRYTILPGGEYYIETLWKMGIVMDKYKTAELGQTLKKVYHKEYTIQDCIDRAMDEVKTFFDRAVAANVEQQSGIFPGVICSCPLCGGDIRAGKKSYYCSNYKTCDLNGLWKQVHFVNISEKDIIALLKGSVITKTFKTKTGKKAFKKLRYDMDAGEILDVTGEPLTAGNARSRDDAQTVNCPVCGKPIVERPTSFSCMDNECGFVLWKQSRYFDNTIRITTAKAKALLSGKHALFTLRNKSGKEYEGYLKLKVNGKYANFEADGFPKK